MKDDLIRENNLTILKPMIQILLFLCALTLGQFAASAETAEGSIAYPALSSPDDFRPLRPTNPGRVDQVIDGRKLRLQDGRIVELSGIDIPQDFEPQAVDFLREFFKTPQQQAIRPYITPKEETGRVTRLGHELAHMARAEDHLWVQGALIRAGLARAWPTPSNPEMSGALFAAEQEAMAEHKGLWAMESPHRIQQADQLTPSQSGAFVVEGTVRSAAIVNNVTYLNFGPDWKTDFTIALPRTVRVELSKAGVDALQLQGKFIRARGWVRPYNGPYMELEHAVLLQHELKTGPGP